MKITKVDDQQYDKRYIWPKGWYACRIVAAGEGESKAGNPYFKIEVQIARENSTREVPHILMASGARAWTLRNACEAFGIMAVYDSGEIAPRDLLDCEAMAQIEIEKKRDFPPRNIITEFAPKLPEGTKAAKFAKMERSSGK